MKISELLSRDEIKSLTGASDLRGAQAVATTWLMIALSFGAVAAYPSVFTILPALIILGGRHLALAILMHDASHYSLFRTRALNDFVGAWFCAYPTWQDLFRYREHHLRHHNHQGTPRDPDLSLIEGFPVSRASLRRKITRDLTGVSAVKRIYGLLLMDFGFIGYTVANDVRPIDQKGRSGWDVLRTGARNLRGVVLTNVALFAILLLLGHPWLYLLWFGSYATFFSLFVRIRSLAEHACTQLDPDPFKNTRTTHANALARVTVAPIRVNYHLEHHLLMTVPYFNLPKLHRLLRKRGALGGAYVAPGYLAVLRLATTLT